MSVGVLELISISIGLAMDAFAVSIGKGLSLKKLKLQNILYIGLCFGIFQAGMPILGYLLGVSFKQQIAAIDHWIAFILLGLIGLNMIKEANEDEQVDDDLSLKTILLLGIATSIDALAVGVTFAFLNVNLLQASMMIGIITFVLSCIGVKIGHFCGLKYNRKAKYFGGLILIFMGCKILIEHLM